MKKTFKIIAFLILGILIILGLYLWMTFQKQTKAQAIADHVIEHLASSEVYKAFPEKYFQKKQLEPIINEIEGNCDWENRDGKFVDFFSMKNVGGIDQTIFIYEYYLACDSLRFLLTVNMENDPELMGLRVEQLETENRMILFPEKQLKNRKK